MDRHLSVYMLMDGHLTIHQQYGAIHFTIHQLCGAIPFLPSINYVEPSIFTIHQLCGPIRFTIHQLCGAIHFFHPSTVWSHPFYHPSTVLTHPFYHPSTVWNHLFDHPSTVWDGQMVNTTQEVSVWPNGLCQLRFSHQTMNFPKQWMANVLLIYSTLTVKLHTNRQS